MHKRENEILSGRCYLLDETVDWHKYLRETEDKTLIETIRKNALIGRPCGNNRFIEQFERKFSRRLKARAHGRPRKTAK